MPETALAEPLRRQMSFAPFRSATVLGAGVMGAQIAAHLANVGLSVNLLDIAPKEGAKNTIVEKAFKAATKLNPDPFFDEAAKKRITLGNFDDDLERMVADVDWVIEVIVERLDIKQELMARLDGVVADRAVISSNTSGLSIGAIAEGRSEDFRRRFLGTHFFNPPRYLKLLELIPTDDTDPDIVARVAWFGRVHLGKGIVVANDTPNFIGNRIGVYAMARTLEEFTSGRYTIEEIDALTGTLIGRPKSATFRTADVVGLDTLRHVLQNLYEGVPDDESRDRFLVPDILNRLVEGGRLGAKSKQGFYMKDRESGDILSINPETFEYEAPAGDGLENLDVIREAGGLEERVRALYDDDGRAGRLFRDTTLDLLAYAARRIPEIADRPVDLDEAMRWGFGYRQGPFETWDVLGFERVLEDMHEAGIDLPDWIETMRASGAKSFYRTVEGRREVYVPGENGYVALPRRKDELSLAVVKSDDERIVWQNDEANLIDIGEQVLLYEFRSKANTLGLEVMSGLNEAVDRVEQGDWRGLVVGNEGANFSVGANLGELAMGVMMGELDQVEQMVARFQATIQRVRYAAKPVVVAAHQRVLGGGCELLMASANPVASAESYIGLVELGVGLIPAGTGTATMAAWAAEQAPTTFASDLITLVRQAFEQIAMAKVATSAREAQEFGYLPRSAVIVLNDDRRLYAARQEVVRLSEQAYLPPPVRSAIPVVGAPGLAQFRVILEQFLLGRMISEYDKHLAERLAYVITGGNFSGVTEVHEDYLIDLEREVFMSLLGEEKTQARVESILTTGKPLRN